MKLKVFFALVLSLFAYTLTATASEQSEKKAAALSQGKRISGIVTKYIPAENEAVVHFKTKDRSQNLIIESLTKLSTPELEKIMESQEQKTEIIMIVDKKNILSVELK